MKILVTGGTGNVGRAAVTRLVKHGHEVRVIGRRAGIVIEGADYRTCDITDYDGLCQQMEGMEAVVHLAAIPHPALAPGQEIFRINCAGAFNVYQAAASKGIKRVVSASSINALGYNFGIKEFPILYFPMDEEHPVYTTDAYSFSKQIVEEIAAYFRRREGISGVCLRLPWVYEATEDVQPRMRGFISHLRSAWEGLLALPDAERQGRVRQIIVRFQAMRAERASEKPFSRQRWDAPDALHIMGRSNFWATIDARDSAQAIEKALLADYDGSHPLFVNDSRNMLGAPSQLLVNTFFPEVKTWKRPVQKDESLVSIDKARKLIGFEPEYSINQWFETTSGG